MKKQFSNILLFISILVALICLLGRNHYLLGTAFAFGKWLIVLIGLFVIYQRRKILKSWLSVFLIITVGLVGTEIILVKLAHSRFMSPETKGKQVSLISYNLFFKNKYPEPILQEIERENSDILLFQEYTPDWEARIIQRLGKKYPHRKTYAHRGTHGLAIFSKYPIKSVKYLRNQNNRPIAQIAELNIDGIPLAIANTHLASPALAVENPDRFWELYHRVYQSREKQLEELQQVIKNDFPEKMPRIIAGDLNTMKFEPLYRDLTYTYLDLFDKFGNGMGQTFPNSAKLKYPLITLDYILLHGNIKPIDAVVLPGSSSDHLAIKGLIEL